MLARRLQNPLIQEYTLHHIWDPITIQGIFLKGFWKVWEEMGILSCTPTPELRMSPAINSRTHELRAFDSRVTEVPLG